jgi:putative ABC transport system permease protein
MSGYVMAVAFLVITVTLAQGYNAVADTSLQGIGTHFVTYIPSSKTCPCEFGEVGPFFKDVYTPTFNSSIVEKIKNLPDIADAAPCLVFRLENLTISGIEVDSLATDTTTVAPDELVKGDYLRAGDNAGVMVDAVFADLSNIKVGDNITEFNRNFTVVGIVNPSLHSKPGGTADMYAPLNVVQTIARSYGDLYNFAVSDINVILVEISSKGDAQLINKVEQSVLETVQLFGGRPGVVVGYQCGISARQVVSFTEGGAWILSAVLLAMMTLFSIKTQFGTVIERTKEIGILKAIGWTNLDVTKQVFLESALQGLAGGIIGIGLGSLAVSLVPISGLVSTQNLVIVVSPLLLIVGLSISVSVGAIAGIIPAWRAAKLQPADALRRF